MKSPNWSHEELKLALELYLDRDFSWHTRVSDSTWEIVALSELLKGLDIYDQTIMDSRFRSPSSIRLKLANFKSLDERFLKLAMDNVGKNDVVIWNEWHGNYISLKCDCAAIIEKHYKKRPSEVLKRYLSRFDNVPTKKIDADSETKRILEMAKGMQNLTANLNDPILAQTIWEQCDVIIDAINKKAGNEPIREIKTHAGINQVSIKKDVYKIGEHVQNTLNELIKHNRLSIYDISRLTDPIWSKNVLHLKCAFLIELKEGFDKNAQLLDINGYVRYWKTEYVINNKKYCACKEWFEYMRKYFDDWVSSLTDDRFEIGIEDFCKVLDTIIKLDKEKVCVPVSELKKQLSFISNLDVILEGLLTSGAIANFQGEHNKIIVEDYDLLFEMRKNPKKYIRRG
jgi:hypothetical protein